MVFFLSLISTHSAVSKLEMKHGIVPHLYSLCSVPARDEAWYCSSSLLTLSCPSSRLSMVLYLISTHSAVSQLEIKHGIVPHLYSLCSAPARDEAWYCTSSLLTLQCPSSSACCLPMRCDMQSASPAAHAANGETASNVLASGLSICK